MNTNQTTTYFKAVRPEGGSFRNSAFRWLPRGWKSGDPIPEGWTVEHPNYSPTGTARRYLSVSTVAADCIGMKWPLVLLEVEPVGEVRSPEPDSMPSKRAGAAFRVVRELPATDALGPQGEHVAALIERCHRLTRDDMLKLGDAWGAIPGGLGELALDAAGNAAWAAARGAAADVAADAMWAATVRVAWAVDGCENPAWSAKYAAWGAALAVVTRDVITRERYDTLTGPWRAIVGPVHPDDDNLED